MNRYKAFYAAVILVFWASSLWAQPKGIYRMHPVFELLDEKGENVINSEKKVSSFKTCSKCHDADYIEKHNSHYAGNVKVECFQCHFEGNRIDWNAASFDKNGNLKKEMIKIKQPSVENCAPCHGVTYGDKSPVSIPDDYMTGWTNYDLTMNTGALVAPSLLSESNLNLTDKSDRNYPWDIHSFREVGCAYCHSTSNNPLRKKETKKELDHLDFDPRKLSIGEYLYRPNHILTKTECTQCHDPFAAHGTIPYRKRHIEKIACQTCHAPGLSGFALKAVDKTVIREDGSFRFEFRSVDAPPEPGRLNTVYVGDFKPYLFASKGEQGKEKIFPYNLVTTIYWACSKDGKEVDEKILKRALFQGRKLKPEVVDFFSKRSDGSENPAFVLDNPEKIDFIKRLLSDHGIKDAVIKADVSAHRVDHGMRNSKAMAFDCQGCHGSKIFDKRIELADFAPEGTKFFFKNGVIAQGTKIEINPKGQVVLAGPEGISKFFIFGFDRFKWINLAGLIMLIMTLGFVAAHGSYRAYLWHKNRSRHEHSTKKVYMYTFYERIWHWVEALAIILLLFTGIEINLTGSLHLFGLMGSVYLHNVLAAVLIVNAFLSLFYHLSNAKIKSFIPPLSSFTKDAFLQMRYYTIGIFKGEPHPLEKSPERKMNPLQQVTYLLLLNVLLPMQMITGIMMWGLDKWPSIESVLGGLRGVAAVHSIGAWLFACFIILHIYLSTTGLTVTDYIKAMITGYEEIELKNENQP